MDTKPIEMQAESLVQHKLLKSNFNISKPSFDKEGADLLIVDNITNSFTPFIKVQCKGRTVKENQGSNLTIPQSYVQDNFILFLYIEDEKKDEKLFIFFKDQIISWKKRDKDYILTLKSNVLNSGEFNAFEFNAAASSRIKELLSKSDIKKYTSLIIDSFSLEKALIETTRIYQEIYPEKEFKKPSLNDIVKNILTKYDRFDSESKVINCYVFISSHSGLKDRILIDSNNNSFKIDTINKEVKIFVTNSGKLLTPEIQEQVERFINVENVILVADDISYESSLLKLKDKGADIILVKLREEQGGDLFVNFRWGDIVSPLGLSIGLKPYEL
jgi:hypothetical protein